MTIHEKYRHDVDQVELLRATGRVSAERSRALLREIDEDWSAGHTDADSIAFRPRRRVLAPAQRRATGALHAPERLARLADAFDASRPRVCVVDDFLEPSALETLYQYCLYSDVWRWVHDGMLGAYPEELTTCDLMSQIVEELRAFARDLFGRFETARSWVFKSVSPTTGIRIHADCAEVTANFWITPDEANLEPTSGGLVVWDAPPPSDWLPAQYSAIGDAPQAQIRRLLETSRPACVRIPYKANRCVIFESGLLHATDGAHFADSIRARRINVTTLFS